ncbi:MAG: LysR family transcriptional regulator [Bdellovibrio sp. CG10_big_fil_rev_8_21_14_0_10_47_8]|nr:MAG: LysR family transcriptional regulator [Bdellovibrio sp. CG10_big_fil_rev_8_21_14_0_10_47_8]
MNQLNYHHLYYFKVIATEGSISKAAQKLLLGQPTLSMQLKQFEEYLGHNLFDRKNRRLVLTEMGQLVLSYANEIFRMGDEMVDAINDRPKSKKIRLQVGALDSVPKNLIKAVMDKAFEYENCQIAVMEGEGPELMDDLINHRLDLVISNAAPPTLSTTEKLYARSLAQLPLIVAASAQYKNLIDNFPRSLQDQPFIFPTIHSRVRNEVEHFFETERIQVDMIAETQDTSLLKMLAMEGKGLIVVAESAVHGNLKDGSLIKIGAVGKKYEELWLISAHRKIQNPVAQKLMKEFQFVGQGGRGK